MEQTHGSSSTDLLPVPIPGGRSLTTTERADTDLSAQIPGWGSDLDASMRAGVPRDRELEIGPESLYPDIERQPAYTLSEGRLTRWMLLLAADRVNMVEGLVSDLARGHLPNLARETGMRASWEHDRAGVTRKAAIALACVAAIALVARSRRRRRVRYR